MPNIHMNVHLNDVEKVNVHTNYRLYQDRHGVNISVGGFTLIVHGNNNEICAFRDAIASGISPAPGKSLDHEEG